VTIGDSEMGSIPQLAIFLPIVSIQPIQFQLLLALGMCKEHELDFKILPFPNAYASETIVFE